MKLIVIEGLDGAGKSTQISLLKQWFAKGTCSADIYTFRAQKLPFRRTDCTVPERRVRRS
jgi:thymidylate kinase